MDELPAILQALPSVSFGFMLVVARVGTAMLIGPGLGENDIPSTVRIGMVVVFSALVYPLLRSQLPPLPDATIPLLRIVSLEIIFGAWMGFITRIMVMSLEIAGDVISFMVGLSTVLHIDPSLGTQVPALHRMLGLAAIALLFASGLYTLPIQAIVGSYDLVPAGSAFDASATTQFLVHAVTDSFGLSMRLAAPFIITSLVWQCAMGFVSRIVPNIQVHLVSAPAQILGGLSLLTVAIGFMFARWSAELLTAFSTLPGL